MSGMASALVAPGAIVAGKYRLDTIVGEGGMGSVWSATHTGLGQAVAIKFISKEFVTSSEALRRFDAEAKAAAQLRSRHVVQVFDNGTLEDGTPYIAMELLRGENLHGRVHRAGPVPIHEGLEILTQCCKALGRAHAAGIVHRDIKPDNIFLAQSTDDEAFLVKILDFGIAKFATGPNDHGSTRTGAVLGTPLYMSPEQARGLKSIDHRTDIYSLGLVAYTIFTGNLAFSSESFGDLLLQICTAPLPSRCANAPWLPATMEAWFQRACAREPGNRFASAQEFAEALRAACDGTLRPPGVGGAMMQPGAPGDPGVRPPSVLTGSGAQAVSVGTDAAMSRSGQLVAGGAIPKGKGPLVALAIVVLAGGLAVAALLAFGRHAQVTDATNPVVIAPPPVAPGSPPLPAVSVARPAQAVEPSAIGAASANPEDAATHPAASAAAQGHSQPLAHPGSPGPGASHGGAPPATAATGGKAIDLGY
jgi:hypothetical protein